MDKKKFDVVGMTCSACVAHVEKSVRKLNGVEDVNVNLLTNSMTVDFDQKTLSTQDIILSVEDAGYEAFEKEQTTAKATTPGINHALEEQKEMKKRVMYSFLFLILNFFYFIIHNFFATPWAIDTTIVFCFFYF